MGSREEFEKWYFGKYGIRMDICFLHDKYYPRSATIDPCAANHINACLLAWRASRRTLEPVVLEEIEVITALKNIVNEFRLPSGGVKYEWLVEIERAENFIDKLQSALKEVEG